MEKCIALLCIVLFVTSATAQLKLNDFDDASIYFDGIFNESSQLDDYGNVLIDMGSASGGKYMFRITDVNISMFEENEKPGCADICPPRIIIEFKCRKSECVIDPILPDEVYSSGSLVFEDLKKGKKAYEYLQALKTFMKNN